MPYPVGHLGRIGWSVGCFFFQRLMAFSLALRGRLYGIFVLIMMGRPPKVSATGKRFPPKTVGQAALSLSQELPECGYDMVPATSATMVLSDLG